jgi:transcription-repair coupling factor (superfamily II helicase)
MSLRPLLQIATENGSFRSLATAVRAGSGVDASMSPGVRPYLLGALVEAEYGLPDRPVLIVTADDRSARDLARELGAYLAPRRVRHYPSRGAGYESHVAPPPHLVGLRIAALDALTGAEAAPVVVGGEGGLA